MRRIKITKPYPDCGHSYEWSLEDLQEPDQHTEDCPICRVVLTDPQEDFVCDDLPS